MIFPWFQSLYQRSNLLPSASQNPVHSFLVTADLKALGANLSTYKCLAASNLVPCEILVSVWTRVDGGDPINDRTAMKPTNHEEWITVLDRSNPDLKVPLSQLEREWNLIAQECIDGRWGGCTRCWSLDPGCERNGVCKRAQKGPRDRAIKSIISMD